jgi:hypothetical protein
MLEEALVYAAAFVIVGLVAIYTWAQHANVRLEQENLNYREELRSGRAAANQSAGGSDWITTLAAFAMSPQGQQVLTVIGEKLKNRG